MISDSSPIFPRLSNSARFTDLGFQIDERLSYGTSSPVNAIILGDNLTALKALSHDLKNSVTCIYIDPPYNNQECYTHYDDALSHEAWLAAIEPRITLLWNMLHESGSLWISIDDREMHYLKVALDSICTRKSFITTIVWEHRISRENRKTFSNNHEYIMVYAKNPSKFKSKRNPLPLTQTLLGRYRNPDEDPRGAWQSVSINVQAGHGTSAQFYDFLGPNGRRYAPPNGRCWSLTQQRLEEEISKNNIWFGKNGLGVPRMKKFLADNSTGLTPETLWRAHEVGTTSSAKKHLLDLFPKRKQFDTPKPESLIARILHIATAPGDLVLDAYLGSGTTAAVAHKMQRRYIGIEHQFNAARLAASRIQHVIKGEQGGISSSVGWTGGGGFKFMRQS